MWLPCAPSESLSLDAFQGQILPQVLSGCGPSFGEGTLVPPPERYVCDVSPLHVFCWHAHVPATDPSSPYIPRTTSGEEASSGVKVGLGLCHLTSSWAGGHIVSMATQGTGK